MGLLLSMMGPPMSAYFLTTTIVKTSTHKKTLDGVQETTGLLLTMIHPGKQALLFEIYQLRTLCTVNLIWSVPVNTVEKVTTTLWTDSNGEFEIFPLGDDKCTNRGHPLFDTGYGTCIAQDGNGALRSNFWGPTDVRSELVRTNAVLFINHDMENGMESFTELAFYKSDSDRTAHASYAFSSSKHRVGPDNYYLNQLKVDIDGVPTAIFAGKNLYIDNYRYEEKQRMVNVKKETYRFLQGLRGTNGDWDWEAAFVTSKATSDDVTSNRMSNNLLKAALYDSTPAAYNPFSAGVNSNIERTLIDVYRKGSSELTMIDYKMSNTEFLELPAGDIAVLVGVEYRDEEIVDDRDPRLDGLLLTLITKEIPIR